MQNTTYLQIPALRIFSLVIASALGIMIPGIVTAADVYTDLSSWQASAPPGQSQTFDFEGVARLGSYSTNSAITGLSISVANFGPPNEYYIVSSSYAGGTDALNGTDALQAAYGNGATTTFQYDGLATAFGTLIGYTNDSPSPGAGTFTAQLFNGSTQVGSTYTSQSIQNGFIGFISDVAFDRVMFTNTHTNFPSAYLTFDNMTFAPEPSRFLLVMGGIVPMIMRRRRSGSTATF